MTTFWQKLETSIRKHNSLLCVGLDPQPNKIPARYASVGEFNRAIIAATQDVACCYKPNIAFYEALGETGLAALRETLATIPADTPVILDAKRNDIASTAAAYAKSAFEVWGVDALTVNPYLGLDGVQPFLDYTDKGVFLLCKTSNPSAGEIQDWGQAGEPLYRHVAQLAEKWAGGKEIGLVIGATYPEAIAETRSSSPATWFLVPGVGAQGGELEAALRAGLRPDGMGLIVNSSREILYAADPRATAQKLRDKINAVRGATAQHPRGFGNPWGVIQTSLARGLFEAGCVRFGDFVLHSGAHSPVYIDLRRLVTYPRLLAEAARAYARLLRPLRYDRIAAIPYAALPIGTAVALEMNQPLIYPRREAKSYGTKKLIEGEYQAGERIVLLDDLITTGGSKLEALEPLLAEGLIIEDIVVLIDREQGGVQELAQKGYRVHAALTLRQIVDILEREGKVPTADALRVREYLRQV
jgi:uridine monophosphate synthetase